MKTSSPQGCTTALLLFFTNKLTEPGTPATQKTK